MTDQEILERAEELLKTFNEKYQITSPGWYQCVDHCIRLLMTTHIERLKANTAKINKPRPTVAELEALLNSENDRPITINPDGSIS